MRESDPIRVCLEMLTLGAFALGLLVILVVTAGDQYEMRRLASPPLALILGAYLTQLLLGRRGP